MKKLILWLTLLVILGLHSIGVVVCAQEEAVEESTTNGASNNETNKDTDNNSTSTVTKRVEEEDEEDDDDDEKESVEETLEKMTNEELEAICTTRGFELVQDLDENGNVRQFSRDDYMDAAKQCLDVESEM